MGPLVSRDPLPPVCPPSPGFVGLSGRARLSGRAAAATSLVATDASVTPGEGTGQSWAQAPGPTCNRKAGMRRRSGGDEASRSDLGYFCRVWLGGFRFGGKKIPLLGIPLSRCKPGRATETLGFGLLGVKGRESTRLGNNLGFLFLFPPKPGREEQLPGESQPRGVPEPRTTPRRPHPGPRSARLRREAAFKAPSSRVDCCFRLLSLNGYFVMISVSLLKKTS